MSINNNTTRLNELLQTIDTLPDKSSGVELPELTNPASEAEVFSGKEYIDDNGNKKTGSFSIDSELSQQDTLITQIQSALEGKAGGGSGLDTSDATATASDMAKGVTAYVNGEKITGTVAVTESGKALVSAGTASHIGDAFSLAYSMGVDRLLREGAAILLSAPSTDFGDAETGDVVAGKTFTSANGLKIEGTGSLIPSELTKLAMGTFTLASDLTTLYFIDHNFGECADFYMIWADDVTINSSSVEGCRLFDIMSNMSYYNASASKTYACSGIDVIGTGNGDRPVDINMQYADQIGGINSFFIQSTDGSVFMANITYHWICGVLKK